MAKKYIVSVDLGQAQDSTIFSVLQAEPLENSTLPRVRLRRMERPQLGIPYTEIVRSLCRLIRGDEPGTNRYDRHGPIKGFGGLGGDSNVDLVVDATGVGRPVVDLMRESGLHPFGIMITGGDSANYDSSTGFFYVPKRDICIGLAVAVQQARFTYPSDFVIWDPNPPPSVDAISKGAQPTGTFADFLNEVQNFRVKINVNTAHDSYEAWRGQHDDMVLSAAMGVWWAERGARRKDVA